MFETQYIISIIIIFSISYKITTNNTIYKPFMLW